MGLMKKLFGAIKTIEDIDTSKISEGINVLEKQFDSAVNRAETAVNERGARTANPRPEAQRVNASGWDEIPSEPNQYNYPGTFTQYFEEIFREEFSGYSTRRTDSKDNRRVVYEFFDGGSKSLVVELMSEKSSATRVRRECNEQNIPYLRFYYDHKGWWNVRTYVVNRIRTAIGR